MTKPATRKSTAKAAPKTAAPRVEEDKLASAKAQGQAQFDSIKQMVEALDATDRTGLEGSHEWDRKREAAEQTIHEDALSVQVRSGWYQLGAAIEDTGPFEYEILLCTGGPACRIVGDLSEHGEPETARLEVQDWFQPWTAITPVITGTTSATGADTSKAHPESVMLAYA